MNINFPAALTLAIASFSSLLSTASQLHAVEHAVVVMANSPSRLQEIEAQLPEHVRTEMRDLASSLTGSLLSIAAVDQPAGLWLDWKGDLPLPVFFMSKPRIEELQAALKKMSIETKDTGEGIFELSTSSPTYYRELGTWFFFGTNREDLRQVTDPTKLVSNADQHIVMLKANLAKIPLTARKEIAKVLATRLLPFPIDGKDAITPENMVHNYGKRLLDSIAEKSKSLELGVNVTAGRLVLDMNVEANRPLGNHKKSANPLLPQLTSDVEGLRFHSTLADEEVAFLSWWAQSVPDRVRAAFKQAQIEDRSGEKGLEKLAKIGSDLLFKLAQRGEVEGYVATSGGDSNAPLVALSIADSDWLDAQFRQFIASGLAAEMLVQGAEMDLETIAGVKLHRLTVSEDADAPIAIVLGIGRNTVFLTEGEQGLKQLREHLTSVTNVAVSPTPLALHIPEISLGTILGWQADESQPASGVHLTSEYTELGTHYQVQFGE